MTRALRIRAQPKPHHSVRVAVFVPRTEGWHCAGALHLSESLWRLLLYPLLCAGAVRCGVTLTLET